jgi:hypothetical protein
MRFLPFLNAPRICSGSTIEQITCVFCIISSLLTLSFSILILITDQSTLSTFSSAALYTPILLLIIASIFSEFNEYSLLRTSIGLVYYYVGKAFLHFYFAATTAAQGTDVGMGFGVFNVGAALLCLWMRLFKGTKEGYTLY